MGGILLLFVIIGIASAGNDPAPSPSSDPAGAPPAPPAPAAGVMYEVESDGNTAMITYTVKGFNIAQDNGAALPWRKEVDLGRGFITGASVTAQADQSANSITCRITNDGEVVAENTSTGQFAVVTCSK